MHEAVLLLEYPDMIAQALEGALSPETENEVPKTRATITRRGGALTVRIVAEDLSSLRAAVNSYLRWVDAAERSARVAR